MMNNQQIGQRETRGLMTRATQEKNSRSIQVSLVLRRAMARRQQHNRYDFATVS